MILLQKTSEKFIWTSKFSIPTALIKQYDSLWFPDPPPFIFQTSLHTTGRMIFQVLTQLYFSLAFSHTVYSFTFAPINAHMHAKFNHHLKSKQNQTEKYLKPSRKQKPLSLPASARTMGRQHREMFHSQDPASQEPSNPPRHTMTFFALAYRGNRLFF